MSDADMLHIYIIAGEASGDLLGAHLMRSLKEQSTRPIKFHGIGGDKMQAEGLRSLFDYRQLSLFGFAEVLPQTLNLFARINQTADDILQKQPDMVITIDVPGFNLRVLKKVRNEKIRSSFVHYVAPTVWAYNAWRAHECAELFDHMLVLLPFEPPYFEQAGLPTTFVGHPVIGETDNGNKHAFIEKYQLQANHPILAVLPGSRRSEIKRHLPIFGRAIAMLSEQHPNLALAVAVPKHLLDYVAPYFVGCPCRAVIISDPEDKKNALAAADLAITKSGTVTLEVAKAGVPMIVTYKVNPLSAWALKKKITIPYVSIINLLQNKEIVLELLQERCTPELIDAAAQHYLTHPELRQAQIDAASQSLSMLLPENGQKPSDIAATAILKILTPPSQN